MRTTRDFGLFGANLLVSGIFLVLPACGGSPTPPTPVPTPAAPPTVTSIDPTSGSTAGGTSVTVNGTGFVSGATLSLGGTPATDVNVTNSTRITARSGARAAGMANVVVTNPDGQSATLANAYSYDTPLPTAVIEGPTSFNAGVSVTFSGLKSTPPPSLLIRSYQWDCGQPNYRGADCRQDNPTPTFRYSSPDPFQPTQYTITLTVEDTQGNQSVAAQHTVTVGIQYGVSSLRVQR